MSAFVHPVSAVTFGFDRPVVSYRRDHFVPATLPRKKSFQADDLSYKVAESQEERESAFRLVYQVYREAGLMAANESGMRVTKYHLENTTDVLVAKHDDNVVFTLTSVRDGKAGLPLESIFADEVAQLRRAGLRLAEVSCLASQVPTSSKKLRFEILVNMMSLMAQQAQRNQVDRILLAVHPRHAKVYERLFGCKICSGEKTYAAVEGNPAVLCSHDFAATEIDRYPLYDASHGSTYAPWQLSSTAMSDNERAYFAGAMACGQEALVPMAA